MTMRIKNYTNFNDLPDSITSKVDELPIFVQPVYARLLFETKGWLTSWYLGYDSKGACFLLPMAVHKTKFYTKGICLFSTIYLDNTLPKDQEQVFLDSFIAYIEEYKICDWIQQGMNWAFFNTVPNKTSFCDFGTFRVDLKSENLGIRRDQKREIRKAIQNGCELVFGIKCLKDAHSVIRDTLSNASLTTYSYEYLQKLTEILKDKILIGVVYLKQQPQAAVIAYQSNHSIYAIYAGSIYKSFPGSTPWIYQEMYETGIANGVLYFDFVGAVKNPEPESKLYRIQQFKRHMGGKEIWGYLWRYVINKRKYFIYTTILKLYCKCKHKKYGDIIYRETGK